MTPYSTARLDLGRMPRTRNRYPYGLRSESAVDGYYRPASRPKKRREPRPDPVTGLIGPIVPDDDDLPVPRYSRDLTAERRAAGVIRMGDLD